MMSAFKDEAKMLNRNGIPFVPPPRRKPHCTNHRTGRRKRTFYARAAAILYLNRRDERYRNAVEVYECPDGHFHLTRKRQGWQERIASDAAAKSLLHSSDNDATDLEAGISAMLNDDAAGEAD